MNDQENAAVKTLCRVEGFGRSMAEVLVAKCQGDEVAALASGDPKAVKPVLDAVADRDTAKKVPTPEDALHLAQHEIDTDYANGKMSKELRDELTKKLAEGTTLSNADGSLVPGWNKADEAKFNQPLLAGKPAVSSPAAPVSDAAAASKAVKDARLPVLHPQQPAVHDLP